MAQTATKKKNLTIDETAVRLLAFTYVCPYVTREINQRSFPELAARSTAHRTLKRLTEAKYLKATRASVNEPLIYTIAPKGIRILNRKRPPERHIPKVRDETGKPWRLKHELGISEFQADVRLAAHAHSDLDIRFFERRYFQKDKQRLFRYPMPKGEGTIRPDLGFLASFVRNETNHFLFHVTEYDRGTEDPIVVLKKLQAYDLWHETVGKHYLEQLYRRHGATDPRPMYRRVIITTHRPEKDRDDHDRLCKLIAQFMELPKSRFNIFITTEELLRVDREEQSPLSSACWFPLRFTRGWQSEYRELKQDHEQRRLSGSARTKEIYAWVHQKVTELPPHALFPPSA